MKENFPGNIRSIERALKILECYYENDELSLSEISSLTALSTSTVYRIIMTLESLKYLERNENNKKYYLGYKFTMFSRNTLFNIEDNLRKASYPYLVKLREIYGETVALNVIKGNSRVCLERVRGKNELSYSVDVGDILPLNRSAAGKVLLAYLDKDELQKLGLENIPPNDVLEEIRKKGYSITANERVEGRSSIACPIFNSNGKCVASILVAGATSRIFSEKIDVLTSDLKKYSMEISNKLGYFSNKSN
jgi:DNA-binding IclR family transcriptional regulator